MTMSAATPPSPQALLSIESLNTVLETEQGLARAVDALSLSIARRETFALVGESGCGKSMTALSLLRLLPDNGRIEAGAVRLAGDDLLALPELSMQSVRGGRIGIIFQEPATSLNAVMTVGRQVAEVIERHTDLRGAAAREKAIAWLERVGLPEARQRYDQYPFQLSGGQKQRVMIALALAAEPALLIADEPTTALDVTIQAQILALLSQLQREQGMGLLLITHDLAVVRQMAHRVALMYAGQIVEVAPTEAFFAQPRHPYAQLLLRALPGASRRGEALAAIPGVVPSLTGTFTGCRFRDRCDRAQAACALTAPVLEDVAADHQVRCLLALDESSARASLFEPAVPVATTQAPRTPTNAPVAADAAALPQRAALEVTELRVRYRLRRRFLGRGSTHFEAVRGVSFSLAPGRTLALVGESGCGKTTIGKAVLRLLDEAAEISGEVRLAGRNLLALQGAALREARRDIQIIFQDPFASLNPRLRVGEILQEGLQSLHPELDAGQRSRCLAELVARVGLRPDAIDRYPHEFSGGQRQRIAIARALAVSPKVLICDEPTSALDVSVQAQILNLLVDLQRDTGMSYLFITHNIGVVEAIADEVAVMRDGQFEEKGPALEILGQPARPYTRELLAAVPRIA